MEIRKIGKMSLTLVSTPFVVLAHAQASALGAPQLPLIVVEHPFGTRSPQELSQIAQKCVDQLLALVAGDLSGKAGT